MFLLPNLGNNWRSGCNFRVLYIKQLFREGWGVYFCHRHVSGGDGRPLGLQAEAENRGETTPGHVTGLSIFWSILDCSRVSAQPTKMTKLQFLNVFLTERLMLAAQEIYKSVEDTILEYQEEIAIRERENDHLRRKLRDAGIEIWPG